MSDTPELKQFGELTYNDFQRHPVWIACHVVDYDEPWHAETDEETFRPYSGSLPADPSELLLVRAIATLNDGSQHDGFLSPAQTAGDMGTLQPHIFVSGHAFGFWGGIIDIPESERRRFLGALGKGPDVIFPIQFVANAQLSEGVVEAEVDSWLPLTPDPDGRSRGRRWWQRDK